MWGGGGDWFPFLCCGCCCYVCRDVSQVQKRNLKSHSVFFLKLEIIKESSKMYSEMKFRKSFSEMLI